MTHLLTIEEPGSSQLTLDSHSISVGIDLGTTHSLISYVDDTGEIQILDHPNTGHLLPSMVAYTPHGIHVGKDAQAQLEKHPELVIKSVKRAMRAAGVTEFKLGSQSIGPVDVSAEILKALKAQAEKSLNQPIENAVITVPAYFDEAARAATKAAAEKAGLHVLRLLSEPTAAALAYGLDQGVEGLYAIYDLGGGTFDFSLLHFQKGIFRVLATGGDPALGGDDFEEDILLFFKKNSADLNTTLSKNPELKTEVLFHVRALKEKLSTKSEASISFKVSGLSCTFSLTRAQYEALIQPRLDQTLSIVKGVLKDARLTPTDISGIVLVGGGSRTPMVVRMLANYFEKTPLNTLNPDEVVVRGAALQAHALTHGSQTLLLDVTPLSLGLETMGEIVEKIIDRNTPIPISKAQTFTTYQDGQTALSFHIVQGERELVRDCRSLARFELRGIPPKPAGVARVRVTFTLDADGLLTVIACEETTGIQQEIAVVPTYGLSIEDVKDHVYDSLIHGEEDLTQRLFIQARVGLEREIETLRGVFESDQDLLTPEESKTIEQALDAAHQAASSENRDDLLAARETLSKGTLFFAERIMNERVNKFLVGKEA